MTASVYLHPRRFLLSYLNNKENIRTRDLYLKYKDNVRSSAFKTENKRIQHIYLSVENEGMFSKRDVRKEV